MPFGEDLDLPVGTHRRSVATRRFKGICFPPSLPTNLAPWQMLSLGGGGGGSD